jgi:hypothetical protein
LTLSVTEAYPCPLKTNAIETKMGRNEYTQREPGMSLHAFFSFSF